MFEISSPKPVRLGAVLNPGTDPAVCEEHLTSPTPVRFGVVLNNQIDTFEIGYLKGTPTPVRFEAILCYYGICKEKYQIFQSPTPVRLGAVLNQAQLHVSKPCNEFPMPVRLELLLHWPGACADSRVTNASSVWSCFELLMKSIVRKLNLGFQYQFGLELF